MTLKELLAGHGAAVISRRDKYGLVEVGRFKSYDAAKRFVDEAAKVEGCRFPSWDPVEPESRSNFIVVMYIKTSDPLFTQLPEFAAHPLKP